MQKREHTKKERRQGKDSASLFFFFFCPLPVVRRMFFLFFSERKARGDSPLCTGEGFPFLFVFSQGREEETAPGRQEDSFLSLFSFFSFSLPPTGSAFLRDDGFRCSRLFFLFLFWEKWRERPSRGKSKKDGGSSLLATDSDSMAISFFSFSLLKGWQGDAFRRRDEKDIFPRRKTGK